MPTKPKLVLSILLLLFMGYSAQGQVFKYGISGGFNSSRLVTKRSLDTTRFKSLLSPHAGFNFSWRFYQGLSLETGAYYSLNGGRRITVSDTLITRERYGYHYFQIPVALQYIHKEFIFIKGGAYFGVLTDAYYTQRSGPPDFRGRISNPTRYRNRFTDLRQDFFPLDVGTWFSVGMQFASGYNFELRYSRSLKPVRRVDKLYNSVFSVSLNYIINYGEKGTIFFSEPARHVFYTEFAGTTFGASLNYEYVFFQHLNVRLAGRAGLGFSPFNAAFAGVIPLGVSAIVGKKNHHLEMGLAHSTALDKDGVSLFGIGVAGYRFQKPNGGIFFRISYNPYMPSYKIRNLGHWGGISVGWALKGKQKD